MKVKGFVRTHNGFSKIWQLVMGCRLIEVALLQRFVIVWSINEMATLIHGLFMCHHRA